MAEALVIAPAARCARSCDTRHLTMTLLSLLLLPSHTFLRSMPNMSHSCNSIEFAFTSL